MKIEFYKNELRLVCKLGRLVKKLINATYIYIYIKQKTELFDLGLSCLYFQEVVNLDQELFDLLSRFKVRSLSAILFTYLTKILIGN